MVPVQFVLIYIIQTKGMHILILILAFFVLDHKDNIERVFMVQCGKKFLTHIPE